jgi:hypothetical protein
VSDRCRAEEIARRKDEVENVRREISEMEEAARDAKGAIRKRKAGVARVAESEAEMRSANVRRQSVRLAARGAVLLEARGTSSA